MSSLSQNDPRFKAMEPHLIALAQQSNGDLRQLMTAFFGFLHRRTDFYLVAHEDDRGKVGFPEGQAEQMLLAAFRQFPLRRLPKQQAAVKSSEPKPATAPSTASKPSTKAANSTKEPTEDAPVRHTEDALQIPVGNGGSTDRYKWTQTLEECSVLIGLPPNTKAKDLTVTLKATTISVQLKSGGDPLLDGTLTQTIKPSESTWTLEGGVLVMVLDKQKKGFWKTVMEGDPEIDTTQVDSRRHIVEYDDATQGQIRKILFDQDQARKGLPSSDQLLGKEPTIPPLPDGVEYIDQEILDAKTKK